MIMQETALMILSRRLAAGKRTGPPLLESDRVRQDKTAHSLFTLIDPRSTGDLVLNDLDAAWIYRYCLQVSACLYAPSLISGLSQYMALSSDPDKSEKIAHMIGVLSLVYEKSKADSDEIPTYLRTPNIPLLCRAPHPQGHER